MVEGIEIVTVAQMRAIESAAMGSGTLSGSTLMTRAGEAVAGQIRLHWFKTGRVSVLCGPGGNGGVGFVVASVLARAGWAVRILGAPPRPGSDSAAARACWPGPVLPLTLDALRAGPKADLYVDAVLGAGLTRTPETEIAAILRHMGDHGDHYRRRLVAVDAPSGLCLDSGQILGMPRGDLPYDALRAAVTVTFDSLNPGHLLEHGPLVCGRLIVADIGLGPFRSHHTPALNAISSRHRTPDPSEGGWLRKQHSGHGHKYTHGTALVVAGDAGGAARLAARAALQVGAGLVTLAPPSGALDRHLGTPDALMCRAVDDDFALRTAMDDPRHIALCLGPGCGVARAAALLPAALAIGRPMVLDADALTVLADDFLPLPPDCVLTPHGGEFSRLFPDLAQDLSRPHGPDKVRVLREAARRAQAVIILKGPDTVIAEPGGRVAIHSDYDLPWLATAGSGDVLAGLITGLLARGLKAFPAACLGVRLHSGAARSHGPGLIADNLIEHIAPVIAGWSG